MVTARLIGHAAALRFQTAAAVAFMGRFGFEALGSAAASFYAAAVNCTTFFCFCAS